MALDEANLARGDKNKVTPEHEPHRYVDMTKGSDMLFANRRDKGFGFTCERGPTLDPVLRLFLRWDTVESGSEVDIGGIKGRMDWQERQALNHNSVAESARLMRASLNLHYAHYFTHCASVDGSKARVEDSRRKRKHGQRWERGDGGRSGVACVIRMLGGDPTFW